jgi:hypothetical protein
MVGWFDDRLGPGLDFTGIYLYGTGVYRKRLRLQRYLICDDGLGLGRRVRFAGEVAFGHGG